MVEHPLFPEFDGSDRAGLPPASVRDLYDSGQQTWIDEVSVAVELPMGPPGPAGPVPTFDVDKVVLSSPTMPPAVDVKLAGPTGPAAGLVPGVWYFDFVVPRGPQGPQGPVGKPLHFMGELQDSSELPGDAVVGDAWFIDPDIWVWSEAGWVVLPDWKGSPGVAGPPTYAYVGPTGPANPVPGQIWFRPEERAYVPTGLRVDKGLQLGGTGGCVWGDVNGDVLVGSGVWTDPKAAQLKVTTTAVRVIGLDVVELPALTVGTGTRAGELLLGSAGKVVRSVGVLKASDPVVADDVATMGWVNTKLGGASGVYVPLSGNVTMTGPLNVPQTTASSAAGSATTKKYVDDAVAGHVSGISQADADARYVNVAGDSMTGQLGVPWPDGDGRAAQVGWVKTTISGGNVSRVNGLRIQAGTHVGKLDANGSMTIPTTFPIESTVIVSNGDYPANPSSVRIVSWSGASFKVTGMQPNKLGRVNWIAA